MDDDVMRPRIVQRHKAISGPEVFITILAPLMLAHVHTISKS